jgi:hypothetical protein
MFGPACSSSACSSSPCGGMHNTCGRLAILSLFSEIPRFSKAWAYLRPMEE